MASIELDRMLQRMFQGFHQDNLKREEDAAKRDPLAHKKTTVMKDTSYRYYAGSGRVLFCYSVHRNVAGFFLGWRERHFKSGKVKRDMFVSRRVKKRCIEIAQRRAAAMKAKALKRHEAKHPVGVGSTPLEARENAKAQQQ